jgi:catechol 2,3-dioxygenase-like lactoylglutathione lyase family enzyme
MTDTSQAPASEPVIRATHLSHGTMQTLDLGPSKRFYREFLGIPFVRHVKAAGSLLMGGDGYLVAVGGQAKTLIEQRPDNRWILAMAVPEDVDRARELAQEHKEDYAIKEIGEISQDGEVRSFCLRDQDSNWWEFRHDAGQADAGRYHDAKFEAND